MKADNHEMDQFRNGALTFPLRDSGPRGGEPVVLLHGFPQVGSSWDTLTPYLTGAGYRVLAPDQRGYAPTALPRGRRAYRMSELAATSSRCWTPLRSSAPMWSAMTGAPPSPGPSPLKRPSGCSSLTALSVPHPAAMRPGRADQYPGA